MTGRWEHFEHDADLGVRGFGRSLDEAHGQAVLALTAAITDPASVQLLEQADVEVCSADPELRFVLFLNAVISEMSTRHLLFGRAVVRIDGDRLDATLWGEPAEVARHQPAVEIKGATVTELRVMQRDGEWLVQTVVDV